MRVSIANTSGKQHLPRKGTKDTEKWLRYDKMISLNWWGFNEYAINDFKVVKILSDLALQSSGLKNGSISKLPAWESTGFLFLWLVCSSLVMPRKQILLEFSPQNIHKICFQRNVDLQAWNNWYDRNGNLFIVLSFKRVVRNVRHNNLHKTYMTACTSLVSINIHQTQSYITI